MLKNLYQVGLVGFRGMVGNALVQRMLEENDFAKINPYFFSNSVNTCSTNKKDATTKKNNAATGACKQNTIQIGNNSYPLLSATAIAQLATMDIIISTQGSDYTANTLPKLKQLSWQGYWIDAASLLRMNDDACICLDPVNYEQIIAALNNGIKTFVGGNCAITIPILGIAPLLKSGLIKWLNVITYQAISGAGSKALNQLLEQHHSLAPQLKQYQRNYPELTCNDVAQNHLTIDSASNLEYLQQISHTPRQTTAQTARKDPLHKQYISSNCQSDDNLTAPHLTAPFAYNTLPWIGDDLGNGTSQEEWKAEVELNKILNLAAATIKVDGYCIRVPTLRCHSAAITLQLSDHLTLDEINHLISNNYLATLVPNDKASSLRYLTPALIENRLKIYVGRIRKLQLNNNIYSLITMGDQLLWGAAEPLRRMLNILIEYNLNRI